jgi:hypothetical protein
MTFNVARGRAGSSPIHRPEALRGNGFPLAGSQSEAEIRLQYHNWRNSGNDLVRSGLGTYRRVEMCPQPENDPQILAPVPSPLDRGLSRSAGISRSADSTGQPVARMLRGAAEGSSCRRR